MDSVTLIDYESVCVYTLCQNSSKGGAKEGGEILDDGKLI
jgi:hypothetical protein